MAKFARYGPAPKYDIPEAGFCLSAFALMQEDNEVLLGVPKEHPRWEAEWAPNFTVYGEEERGAEFRSWRIPAAYLYEGEHPDETLERVVRDQLAMEEYGAEGTDIYAFYDPSDWFPGNFHYDLCFVYELVATPPAEVPPWFKRLEMVDISALAKKDFGSDMGDLAFALGLIQE